MMVEQSRRKFLFSNAAIVLGALLLIGMLWAAVQQSLEMQRHHDLEQVNATNATLAVGLEAHTYNFLGKLDNAIVTVRHEFAQHDHRPDLAGAIDQAGMDKTLLVSMHVLDANGRQIHGTGPVQTDPRSHRELFDMAATSGEDRLLIGKPRLDSATGKWVLEVGRRLMNHKGNFAGVVIAAADPAGIARFHHAAALDKDDIIVLARTDGITLLRMTGDKTLLGMDMRNSTLLKAHARDPLRGTFATRGLREGTVRLMSYRGLRDLPLIVAAGRSQKEALAEIRAISRTYYVFAGAITLALLVLAVVLMRNIARKRQRVRALARDEARFRATFDQAFVGMLQSAPDGRPLQVNRILCDLLGRSEAELLSRPWTDWLCPEDRFAGGSTATAVPSERRLLRGDGSFAWMRVATTQVHDADGRVDCLVTVLQDISEFKRVDRMKNEFVSMVSHELRTPLTSIRGSLGLIVGGVAGSVPQAARSLIEIAKTNCERLVRLINDILDTEKIESGKMRFELRDAELQRLARHALAVNEALASEQAVRFELLAPLDPLLVKVDPDRLEQVFTNLLSNAVKFAPPDSTVQLRIVALGGRARVEVTDRGPGIPHEFRDRIFQRFSQADSSDSRQKAGSGLGLSISKAIVERLGGSIGFTTKVGAGTTFFFELPETGGQSASEAPEGVRPCVLICEDDRDIARLLAMMLANAGFDSDIAYSAGQAREHLAGRRYDVMTVDLKLPDEDGITLIGELRRHSRTAGLPLVVVSAVAEEGRIRINGQARGVSEWLGKPIDESRLVNAVRNAMTGGRRPRILHVDPDPDVQCIVAAVAQDFAAFDFAAGLAEARVLLAQERFDLVLLEPALPDGCGRELLNDVQRLETPPAVILFSVAQPDPRDLCRVQAAHMKTRTSNEELRMALRAALDIQRVGRRQAA